MMPKIFAVLIIIAYVVLLYFIVFGKKRNLLFSRNNHD